MCSLLTSDGLDFSLLPFKKSFLRILFRYNLVLSEKKCTYEFEPEDVNKENMSIAEMSGKKLDWFRKVCAAVL